MPSSMKESLGASKRSTTLY